MVQEAIAHDPLAYDAALLTFNFNNDSDVTALSEELYALGADAQIVKDSSSPNTQVTNVEGEVVARALDHLHNQGASSKDILAARNNLLKQLHITPRNYRLRSWHLSWEEQDQTFWSYTGPYKKGDRLVNGVGNALRVFSVEHEATGIEPGVLAVEP